MKKKLRDVIKDACGWETEKEILETAIGAGYAPETLDEDCELIGDCWDGNNRASVWRVDSGGYHVSAQAGEIWQEELPEDFREIKN